ncbi:essential MCU regulator, mitochondrial-like [Arctopsyche grandis]|uniref:essential MCU regulator, mitochondrial-like n=1 Tax=Arctopsyche grandis TaxID=121162 RepID=UPI00406D95C0
MWSARLVRCAWVRGALGGSRSVVTSRTGAILPEPQRVPLGVAGILAAVVPGLLLGAAISKGIANFLEENDLFVPSDDDDDDD